MIGKSSQHLEYRIRALHEKVMDYLISKYAIFSISKVHIEVNEDVSHAHFRLIFQFGEGSIGTGPKVSKGAARRVGFVNDLVDAVRIRSRSPMDISPDQGEGKTTLPDCTVLDKCTFDDGHRYSEVDRQLIHFRDAIHQRRAKLPRPKRPPVQMYVYDSHYAKKDGVLEFAVFTLPDVLSAKQLLLFPDNSPAVLTAGFRVEGDGCVHILPKDGQDCKVLSLRDWAHYSEDPFIGPFLRDLVSIRPNQEYLYYLPLKNLPITNRDRDTASNLKDLLSRSTGVECSKNVSRWDPVLALSYLKTIRHIHPNDRSLLYQFVANHPSREALIASMDLNLSVIHFKENYEHFSLGILFYYFFDRLNYSDAGYLPCHAIVLIREYLCLSFLSHKYPNLRIRSVLRLVRELDDLYGNNNEERYFLEREVKFFDEYHVLVSDERYEYNFVNNKEHLIKESRELKLCLPSYASKINDGACGFYAITDKKSRKRYVAELVYEEKKFWLNELRGKYNRDAPGKLGNNIKKQLDEVNSGEPPAGLQKVERLGCAF